jgi:hypothetical protein
MVTVLDSPQEEALDWLGGVACSIGISGIDVVAEE